VLEVRWDIYSSAERWVQFAAYLAENALHAPFKSTRKFFDSRFCARAVSFAPDD
jgi:hypothetical protein